MAQKLALSSLISTQPSISKIITICRPNAQADYDNSEHTKSPIQ